MTWGAADSKHRGHRAASKFKVGGVSSFTVNGMLQLLLLFSGITLYRLGKGRQNRLKGAQTRAKFTTADGVSENCQKLTGGGVSGEARI